jgi:hypothetical protein
MFRKILSTLVLVFGLTFLYLYAYQKPTIKYLMYNLVYKYEARNEEISSYRKDDIYSYVVETDDFTPSNKKEVLNIIFTGLNNGWGNFSFYCSSEYATCEDDVKLLANSPEILSNLNNFVHPYNSYNKLYMTINAFGKVIVDVEKLYTDSQIEQLNSMINGIISQKTSDSMTDIEKIRTTHDYILDITEYDFDRASAIETNSVEEIMPNNKSHIAYGILTDGKAICSGYSDMMSLILEKLNIPSYKISSDTHIWNLVKLNDAWYHLDLTWDDPDVDNQTGLNHLFFLITTKGLENKNVEQHEYDKTIFTEAQ